MEQRADGGDHGSTRTLDLEWGKAQWDIDGGKLIFNSLPSAIFWLNPSLLNMLLPLAEEVGIPLFRLMVARYSWLGAGDDYDVMVTKMGHTFEQGLRAWGEAAAVVGWGRFELLSFDREACRARAVVHNPWELEMQRGSSVRWGCPFLLGKIVGLFSRALGENCWADEVSSEPEEAATSVEFNVYRSERTIEAEMGLLRLAHQEEAKQKLAQKTLELRQSEARQRAVLTSLSDTVFTVDENAHITSYHVPREQSDLDDAPEPMIGRHVREVMPEASASPLLYAIAEVIQGGNPRTVNYARGQRGEARFFSTKLSLLRDPVTGSPGVTGIERDITDQMRAEQTLTERIEVIQRQQETIQAMSTPILQVWDGVLALPLVGLIDARRATAITESLLEGIVSTQAQFAILDMTGVHIVDMDVAEHFVRIVRAVELLGAQCLISGIQPAVAQTMISLGMDMGAARTFATMQSALMAATRASGARLSARR